MGKIIRSEAWVLRKQLCSNFQISLKLPPLPTTHENPESVVSGPTTPADKPAGAVTGPPQRVGCSVCGALSRFPDLFEFQKSAEAGGRGVVTFGFWAW